MEFITLEEFRSRTGAGTLKVVKNPNTGKVFMTDGENKWRAQQTINGGLECKFLIGDGETIDEGCLVNIKSENTLFTL